MYGSGDAFCHNCCPAAGWRTSLALAALTVRDRPIKFSRFCDEPDVDDGHLHCSPRQKNLSCLSNLQLFLFFFFFFFSSFLCSPACPALAVA